MSLHHAFLIEAQYLPPVRFFSLWKETGTAIIEQHENYAKGSYRNRCHIASANGLASLSIPLKKGKNEQLPIKETQIAWFESWNKKHWRSIQSAYGNAPFFEYYKDELLPLFEKRYTFLFDWNMDLLVKLKELLQMDVELNLSNSFDKVPEQGVLDMRNKISPKLKNNLSSNGSTAIPYPQVFLEKHDFLPNLSILDLLFCTGPEALAYL